VRPPNINAPQLTRQLRGEFGDFDRTRYTQLQPRSVWAGN
jgi:hypothetical protein